MVQKIAPIGPVDTDQVYSLIAQIAYVINANFTEVYALGGVTSIVGITGTKAQFNTAVTDGDILYVGDAPTAHTHLLTAGATDVTVTAANLNALDDGVNTALHFHDADRARANHTGTQAVGTITGLAAIATSGSAADLSAGTLPAARFDDTAHGARAGGTTHAVVIAAGAAGFMTGTDKTKLDGVATGATANSSDAVLLARANHTGTQLAATISDFSTAADARVVAGITGKQNLDAALTALAAGSDFVQFTGPATAIKVFTLPDASSTLLFSGGALGTPASGTLTNCTGLPTAGYVDQSVTTAKLADAAVTQAQMKIKTVVALADAAATLTATQLIDSGIFTITPTVARILTTATAALIVAALPRFQVGTWFEFTIVVRAAFLVTLAAGVGVTIVGVATANNVSMTFKARIDSATAVTMYRT